MQKSFLSQKIVAKRLRKEFAKRFGSLQSIFTQQ